MKLVVGLGNPGRKYEGTRHNVGFRVAALLAQEFGTSAPKSAFHGEIVEATIGGEKVLLLCPHTLMNLSGQSVLAARDFYKLEHPDLLVVGDDLNLPLGKLRFRASGSSGGQKGLKDVLHRLGSEDVPRLRIGIGSPPAGLDVAGYVLGKFAKNEIDEIDLAIRLAADAAILWVREGAAAVMNKYNAGNKN